MHEIVTFETDEAVRDTIVGQDEFMVRKEIKGEADVENRWKG